MLKMVAGAFIVLPEIYIFLKFHFRFLLLTLIKNCYAEVHKHKPERTSGLVNAKLISGVYSFLAFYINFLSPFPWRLHMKFAFEWPSGFGEEGL